MRTAETLLRKTPNWKEIVDEDDGNSFKVHTMVRVMKERNKTEEMPEWRKEEHQSLKDQEEQQEEAENKEKLEEANEEEKEEETEEQMSLLDKQ